MQRRSRRHHYLPQFYLQRFTSEDGLLCLFDRETKTFRRQQPLNTAIRNEFYTVRDKEGSKSDAIERMLSELESEACMVFTKLDKGQKAWRDEQERVSFAVFLGYLYTRTPAFDQAQTQFAEHIYRAWMKANHPTVEVTAQWFDKLAQHTEETVSDEVVQEFFKMVREGTYTLDVSRQHNIRLMMDTALHVAEVLLTLNWTFVRAPRDLSFITSDCPFTIAPPPGEEDLRPYGILTPGAVTTVPLGVSSCVMIEGVGATDRYGSLPKSVVRSINHNVALNSNRFVIGRDQSYLERLVKRTRIDQSQGASRFAFAEEEVDAEVVLSAKHKRFSVQ